MPALRGMSRRTLAELGLVGLVCLSFMSRNATQQLLGDQLLRRVAGGSNCCGPGCRSPQANSVQKHYDAEYFAWQKRLALRKASERDWTRHYGVQPGEAVLDWGAGTGAILASFNGTARLALTAVECAESTHLISGAGV